MWNSLETRKQSKKKVLSGSAEATPASLEASASSEARGVAWMQMEKSGLVKYFLNLQGLERNVTSIQIDNGRKSQRLLRIAHELGPMQVKTDQSHGVWKSQKKSHSTLRAKQATFTFWVDKS